MGRKRKREAATVSFHYLNRQTVDDENVVTEKFFTLSEFTALVDKLQSLPKHEPQSDEFRALLANSNKVPIDKIEAVNERTVFGQYRGVYTGHAYENTEKGKISASSMNLRPFYFVLYLSEKGRIYIGSQYLGHYGSYTGLRETLISLLPEKRSVVAHSFRSETAAFENVVPKEVSVRISRKGEKITSNNAFDDGAIVVFRNGDRKEDFEEQVKRRLVPVMGTSKEKIQEAVSAILKDSKLVDIEDSQIEDCTIIGQVDGRRKTLYMIGQSMFASQFPLSVIFNEDGHPEYEPTKKAMLDVLGERIVVIKEHVEDD